MNNGVGLGDAYDAILERIRAQEMAVNKQLLLISYIKFCRCVDLRIQLRAHLPIDVHLTA